MKGYHKTFLALFLFILFASPASVMAQRDLLLPAYQCTLTNQRNTYDMSNNGMYTFMTSTPEIFLVCESDTVVKGDSLRAVWIADNERKAGWDNYKIAEKKSIVKKNLDSLDLFRTSFSIKRPQHGWPTGKYHVRVYINGSEGYRYDFVVR